MDCPVCEVAMITCQLDEVEIDYCLDCSGIWLDTGELEMLLEDAAGAKDLLASFKQVENCIEKPRKCPICLKKMEKILAGPAASAQLLDRCKKGDGLWFDGGELGDVLKMGSFDEQGKVQKLLADMFGGKPDEINE
ncbi:MAG: zf-TFIIB domain-containing protein [Planctomycetota bacterium]|jgi:Zn-finger nucleic acid-binding protein